MHTQIQTLWRRLLLMLLLLLAWSAWPPSAATAAVVDDFNDNVLTFWSTAAGGDASAVVMHETNGVLSLSADFDATGNTLIDIWPRGAHKHVSILPGQTLELRMDLLRANQDDAFAWLGWDDVAGGGRGYALGKDPDGIFLLKYGGGTGVHSFIWDEVEVKNENVTLVLAFTQTGGDVEIRCEVRDKEDANAVLYSRSFTDTTDIDPTVRSPKTGILNLDSGSPWTGAGLVIVGLWQYSATNPPRSEILFDNLEANERVLDDFNDNTFWRYVAGANAQPTFTETNQQWVVSSTSSATDPVSIWNTIAVGWLGRGQPRYPIGPGQSLELRMDLVRANQNDAFAWLGWQRYGGGGYAMGKDEDEIFLTKWPEFGALGGSFFFWENAAIKNENVTLALSFSQQASNVVINARILDPEDGGRVLFDRTITDTSAADPMAPYPPTGQVFADPRGGAAYPGEGLISAGLWQFNDGSRPRTEIVLDNVQVGPLPPLLTIAPGETGAMVSWLGNPTTSFALQTSPGLTPSNWTYVPEARANPAAVLLDDPSRFFRLVQVTPLKIIEPPVSLRLVHEDAGAFTVAAIGEGPLNYQWFFNHAEISGAETTTLDIPDAQASQDGEYTVLVSDDVSSLTSAPVTLTVLFPPALVTPVPPTNITVPAGADVEIVAQTTGSLPMLYRWRRLVGGGPSGSVVHEEVVNAHTATLLLTNVQPDHAGTYSLVLTNEAYRFTNRQTNVAVLTVE